MIKYNQLDSKNGSNLNKNHLQFGNAAENNTNAYIQAEYYNNDVRNRRAKSIVAVIKIIMRSEIFTLLHL